MEEGGEDVVGGDAFLREQRSDAVLKRPELPLIPDLAEHSGGRERARETREAMTCAFCTSHAPVVYKAQGQCANASRGGAVSL